MAGPERVGEAPKARKSPLGARGGKALRPHALASPLTAKETALLTSCGNVADARTTALYDFIFVFMLGCPTLGSCEQSGPFINKHALNNASPVKGSVMDASCGQLTNMPTFCLKLSLCFPRLLWLGRLLSQSWKS